MTREQQISVERGDDHLEIRQGGNAISLPLDHLPGLLGALFQSARTEATQTQSLLSQRPIVHVVHPGVETGTSQGEDVIALQPSGLPPLFFQLSQQQTRDLSLALVTALAKRLEDQATPVVKH